MKEAGPPQSPEQVASALEVWLADYPEAVITEDGKVLFDLREAKYSLTTEHNRCTLHLWGAERNLVRRVSAALARGKALRLTTHRGGQAKPSTRELHGEKDRRTPSTREMTPASPMQIPTRLVVSAFFSRKRMRVRLSERVWAVGTILMKSGAKRRARARTASRSPVA